MIPTVALTVALLAASADEERAQRLYEAGAAAYESGRYEVAIDAFRAARALVERPVLDFSLAQAHRLRHFQEGRLSDLEDAVKAYRDFLATNPEGPRRAHATQHLSTLVPYLERSRIESEARPDAPPTPRLIVTSKIELATAHVDDGPPQPVPATFEVEPGAHVVYVSAPLHRPASQETIAIAGTAVALSLDPPPLPARLTVTAPEGARLSLSGRDLGRAPLAAPLELTPGTYELLVRATGHQPQVRELAVRPDESATVGVELEATGQRTLAWVLIGTACAAAVGAAITGTLAWESQNEAEALESRVGQGITGESFARHAELSAARDDYAAAALGLGLAAGATLAGGLLLYFLDDPAPPPQVRANR